MSPLFAAMPPPDLPTAAYVPTALHSSELLLARSAGSHTVRSGDTVYGIAARYGVSPQSIVRANGLRDGGRWILPGTTLVVPGKGGSAVTAPPPGSSAKAPTPRGSGSGRGGAVTVRRGDTLSHIAVRHGTTVAALAKANGLRDTRIIYVGQVLHLPG
ncbi:MAG: hypothetical protein DCC50_15120, partial [Acidobacteria bacterium]